MLRCSKKKIITSEVAAAKLAIARSRAVTVLNIVDNEMVTKESVKRLLLWSRRHEDLKGVKEGFPLF